MHDGKPLLEAYPLYWPEDQKRTPDWNRARGKFAVTFARARDELLTELDRMGARDIILSTNVPVRNDGLPYANAREPKDPGVAVYFTHSKRSLVIACDSYDTVKGNVRAVWATAQALRTIQRHGATSLLERAFTGFTALPPKGGGDVPWYEVLGVEESATFEEVKAKYRELARLHHPDSGGDAETMSRLNQAFQKAEEIFHQEL